MWPEILAIPPQLDYSYPSNKIIVSITYAPLVKAIHGLKNATIKEKYLTRQDGSSDNGGQPKADRYLLRQ